MTSLQVAIITFQSGLLKFKETIFKLLYNIKKHDRLVPRHFHQRNFSPQRHFSPNNISGEIFQF